MPVRCAATFLSGLRYFFRARQGCGTRNLDQSRLFSVVVSRCEAVTEAFVRLTTRYERREGVGLGECPERK